MGDLQTCLPQSNTTIGDYDPPPSPTQPSNPHPLEIKGESWRLAEQATQELIQQIQPTVVSEERRAAVIEYVQNLLKGFLNTEVLPFGSVPLKTYLPDGDIDLTALGVPNEEDSLARSVFFILQKEGQKRDAVFEVNDVQSIHAEVRLVKCLVQNIVVDISFNQIGGLSTLCFLEQVDRYIGKNNLYKRSIMLIKAWCYYESRILGAHHGLISTYALETLVLYIFHLFHSSLDGPLAVLYRFLEYYSKFDWDTYCVSLHGPIPISSLPNLAAEAPENDGDDLLLSNEFLRNCVDMFADPPRALENNPRRFPHKHLNIVDPLREYNNLGRSVSKGSFYRIRSAFIYGARKLGRMLLLPAESIGDEIGKFFANTLDRHGSGERPDVQGWIPIFPEITISNHHGIGSNAPELQVEGRPSTSGASLADAQALYEDWKSLELPCLDKEEKGNLTQLHYQHPSQYHRDPSRPLKCTEIESNGIMEDYGGTSSLGIADGTWKASKASPPDIETCGSPSGLGYDAPHLCFDRENGISVLDEEFSHLLQPTESLARNDAADINESLNLSNLVDLTGDYDMQFNSLLYANWCRECMLDTQMTPYPNGYYWDVFPRHNLYPHMNANGMVPGPPFSPPGYYMMNPNVIPGAYSLEDMPKPRGTGTYFPNANSGPYKERRLPGRGRNAAWNQMSRTRNNGRANMNIQENGSQDPSLQCSHSQLPVFGRNDRARPAILEVPKTSQINNSKAFTHANGFVSHSDRKAEFGSFGSNSWISPSESRRRLNSSVHAQGSVSVIPAPAVDKSASGSNPERSKQTYQLKNDDDFPPLNG